MEKYRNADGTYDGAAALGELAGIERSEVMNIWEQVKGNSAKLNACRYHEFERVSTSEFISKYRCKNCGGEVDALARHWHEQGRRARA